MNTTPFTLTFQPPFECERRRPDADAIIGKLRELLQREVAMAKDAHRRARRARRNTGAEYYAHTLMIDRNRYLRGARVLKTALTFAESGVRA